MLICVTLCHFEQGVWAAGCPRLFPRPYPYPNTAINLSESRGYLGTIFADMTTEKHTLGTLKVVMTV